MNQKKAKFLRQNVYKMGLNPFEGQGKRLYKRFKRNYKNAPEHIRRGIVQQQESTLPASSK